MKWVLRCQSGSLISYWTFELFDFENCSTLLVSLLGCDKGSGYNSIMMRIPWWYWWESHLLIGSWCWAAPTSQNWTVCLTAIGAGVWRTTNSEQDCEMQIFPSLVQMSKLSAREGPVTTNIFIYISSVCSCCIMVTHSHCQVSKWYFSFYVLKLPW